MSGQTSGSWQPDPTGRHQLRWHDGATWTDQVADGGQPSGDAMPAVPPVDSVASRRPGKRRPLAIAVVVAVVVGALAFFLLGGDDGLSDDQLGDLADDVVDDVDLPGGGDLDIDDAAFSLECPAEAIDVDEDEAVRHQAGPVGGQDEGEAFGRVSVAVFVLSDAGVGQRLVDAFSEDGTEECIIEANDLPDDFELDFDEDELDVDGTTARRFEFDGGAQEAFLPVGRLLVDVQVVADDDDRRDDLLLDTLEQLQDGLREGGA